MTGEIGLQMFPKNKYWRCRRDVQRQSVPQSGSSDRKSSIADGWKMGAWDNKSDDVDAERRRWRASCGYCHSLDGATLFSETQTDREFVIHF